MQNQGSIGPTTVAELLRAMQQERATGTLSLASNGHQCALHFLFGHLFHAVGGDGQGEPAVIDALGWHDGEYSFNPRAKLPPEETISSSTEDLLAQWRNGRDNGTGSPAAAEVPAEVAGADTPSRSDLELDDVDSDQDWLDTVNATEITDEVQEPADIPAFQTPAPPPASPPRAFTSPRPAVAAASSVPSPALSARPPNWSANRSLTSSGAVTERSRPGVIQSVAPRTAGSATNSGGQPARPVAGSTRSQLSVVIPMPSGPSLHSGLKASFLNFPMLLKTLAQDGFSGFVSVRGEKDEHDLGHILFREGAILQAQQRSGGSYRRSKAALQEVMRGVSAGEGLIDAIELPAELVGSVSGLIVANTVFLQLPSRIVDFDALIQYLEEQPINGGILVTSKPEQVSVVLVNEGRAKGSYSTASPELTEGPGVASAACADREARIDVVAAPSGVVPVIEISEIG